MVKIIEQPLNERTVNYIAKVELVNEKEIPESSIVLDINLLKHLLVMIEHNDKKAYKIRLVKADGGILLIQTRDQQIRQEQDGTKEYYAIAPCYFDSFNTSDQTISEKKGDFPKVKTSELNILTGLNRVFGMKPPEPVMPKRDDFYVETLPETGGD